MHKIEGANLQCVDNYYAKFEYKGINSLGSSRLLKLGTPSVSEGNNVYVQHPSTFLKKYLLNVHKIRASHLQCVNNHYAKFEFKEMTSVGVTDYTN